MVQGVIPLIEIQTLKLKDGANIIDNGQLNKIDLNNQQVLIESWCSFFKEDKELKPGQIFLLFVTPVALGYLSGIFILDIIIMISSFA